MDLEQGTNNALVGFTGHISRRRPLVGAQHRAMTTNCHLTVVRPDRSGDIERHLSYAADLARLSGLNLEDFLLQASQLWHLADTDLPLD